MTFSNIWCVGRNYADHAKELGNAVPSSPLIFLKAGSCAVSPGTPLIFPQQVGSVHFETELAVQFDAQLQFSHAAVALDFTARDVQNELKAKGHPWTLAKSFRHGCAVGPLKPIQDWAQLSREGELKLWVNGELKQHGFFKDMIFKLDVLREYVCDIYPVQKGDLLLTGTPQGVGALTCGDQLRAEIPGVSVAEWRVGPA